MAFRLEKCVVGCAVVISQRSRGFRPSRLLQPLSHSRLGGLRSVARGRRQAASYLAEERSTKVLRDSELLNEYSKRFAFVVHDIKNLASQLGLVVTNAKRYIDDPNFQRDMLQTIEDAVARMNRLLSQLKTDAVSRTPRLADAGAIVAAVAATLTDGAVTI